MKKIILTENQLDALISQIVDKVASKLGLEPGSEGFKDILKKVESGDIKMDDKEEDEVEDVSGKSDDAIYKKILSKIGAPNTPENIKFLKAWRQAEGAKAKFNPFNTTHKKEGSSLYNCLRKKNGKCTGGVRNYKNEVDGIDATVQTLQNGRYDCIVRGLRENDGAKDIANKCKSELKVWGTGGLIAKVLNGKKISAPPISRSEVKKVGS